MFKQFFLVVGLFILLSTSDGFKYERLSSLNAKYVLRSQLDENSPIHSSDLPSSTATSQRKMLARAVFTSISTAMAFKSPAKSLASTTSICPCPDCQDSNFCPPESDQFVEGNWYDPRNNRIFDTSKRSYLPPHAELYLKTALRNKQIVCVGEVHSNPCHHKLEFDVVKSLSLVVPSEDLAIGLECFYRQHQKALDRYVFFHQDFATLKKETAWDMTWGFDINQYAKIFHYCAINRIRLVGLNVPIQITRLVRKSGLDGLPPSLKRYLPAVDLTDSRHRQRFVEAIRSSGHIPSDPNGLDRMYEAQTLWDEYMSESAANYIRQASPNTVLCVIAGLNHIAGRSGIPDRIRKRTGTDPFVIIPQQVEWYSDSGLPNVIVPPSVAECDWAWFTQREIMYS